MERYFNAYKVRYNFLDSYLKPIKNTQMIRTMNIFINLDDFFHKIHTPFAAKEFQVISQNAAKQLTSNIFNLIGHYKNWAVKSGIKPKIFIVYTTAGKTFKNKMHVPTYRDHYLEISSENNGNFYHINQAIQNSRGIIPVIAKYIKNVYAIDSKYLEPSATPLYLSDKFKADWNLLISRDEYDIQYCYKDRWSLMQPLGDFTQFITKSNMWEHVINKEKITVDHQIHYAPALFPMMLAVAGDRYRTIPRLKKVSWKSIFKWMDEVSSSSSFIEQSIVELQEDRFVSLINKKKMEIDALNENLYCVDIERQVAAFMETDKAIIDSCIEDMEDFKALNQINVDVFREFPLNLQFLCREIMN